MMKYSEDEFNQLIDVLNYCQMMVMMIKCSEDEFNHTLIGRKTIDSSNKLTRVKGI